MATRRLVLLDFDGTLTKSDTFLDFILFYHGWFRFAAGFLILSPWLVAMKLKILRNDLVKQRVLRFFFADAPADYFNKRCADFARIIVPSLLRAPVQELLSDEKKRNARIIVVSASPENWVKPWCDAQEIECLATRLETTGQKITGNLNGKNCYGPEKAARINEILILADFSPIVAFGDSRGDNEMLALADEPHYRKL